MRRGIKSVRICRTVAYPRRMGMPYCGQMTAKLSLAAMDLLSFYCFLKDGCYAAIFLSIRSSHLSHGGRAEVEADVDAII